MLFIYATPPLFLDDLYVKSFSEKYKTAKNKGGGYFINDCFYWKKVFIPQCQSTSLIIADG